MLAPTISIVTAICGFAVVPYGPTVEIAGRTIGLVVLDVDGALLLWMAATSLGVYGIVCAGWSSRSKYSMLGGLRSSAQMVSYELTFGLSIVGVLLVGGTPEANRLPFDLPEAESELVAGYHTEYSSMKLLMFYIAEYIAVITTSAMAVTLFLGGYQLPVPNEWLGLTPGWLLWSLQILCFALKVGVFLFLFIWVRWTLPRLRYDQLMALGWKGLFPLALLNVVFTAALVALR